MRLIKLIFVVSTIAILILAAKYISSNLDSFKKITEVTFSQACVFAILQLATFIVNALALSASLDVFGIKLSFRSAWQLTNINTLLNYLFMKGGMVAKGYFLKKLHKLSYTDYTVSSGLVMLLNFVVAGILGIFLLIFSFFKTGILNFYLFLFFSLLIVSFYALVKLSPKIKEAIKNKRPVPIKKLYIFFNSWVILSGNRRAVLKLSFLMFLNFFAYALRLKYGFHILYNDVPLTSCLVISILGVLAAFLAITPAALGIREFAVGAGYSLMHGNMVEAVVVTAVDRAISFILIFFFGAIACYSLIKKSGGFGGKKNKAIPQNKFV